MRIIAGKFRGRIIKVPKSKLVRPPTDKNREAIFNYLNNIIDFSRSDVLDLYAGSGALGIESISRGSENVHFVENNFIIYKNLLNNLDLLKATAQSKVFKMSCVKFTSLKEHKTYNLIIADPPFFKNDIYKVIENIKKNNYLDKEGILIIERSVQTEKEDIENFRLEPIKKLGDSLIYQFLNN
jgi:16S rRNA (guanine966-N2)-methyltransferase